MNRKSMFILLFASLGLQTASASWILVGWNNLGMHCMDSDYSVFSILPPYNTIQAQLVSSSGQLVRDGAGITVTYEAVADLSGSVNTTSIGKTNFWKFVTALYGASLAPDAGLAGPAMPGSKNDPQPMTFDLARSVFGAEGIPLIPYDDEGVKNYYPMMRLTARDSGGSILAATNIVLPVSDEMSCRACHMSGSNAAAKPAAGWVSNLDGEREYRLNVLRVHDDRQKTDQTFLDALRAAGYNPAGLFATVTQDSKPILCARCHGSNALPGTGMNNIKPLTEATHGYHAHVVLPSTGTTLDSVATRAACYSCHPGSTTRCLRGVMGNAVAPDGTIEIQCQDCHGPMSAVGRSGRQGWLEEPTCQNCHTGTATRNSGQLRYTSVFSSPGQVRQAADQTFATSSNAPAAGFSLYRFSSGHGGLQCEACHGSTHAEFPTSHVSDNTQSLIAQGHVGTLSECTICHNTAPNTVTGGPHGMHPVGQTWLSRHPDVAEGNASQCQTCHGADYRGTELSRMQADRTMSAFGTKQFWRGFQIGCYACHSGPSSENANRNAPPVTNSTSAQADGAPVSLALVATDADRDPLTLRIVDQPARGVVGLNGTLATYSPYPGAIGADSFQFAAWDGSTNSNLATVSITITGPAGSAGVATSVSTASYRGPDLAPGSIATAFGSALSDETRGATVLPLPTPLGGTSVQIVDSRGFERFAPLFMVSPGQVTYAIPANTATGTAYLTVTAEDGTIHAGTLQIQAVSPGVYSTNPDGLGPALAQSFTLSGSSSTILPTFQCDASGANCVTTPIDLGADADQVFLILYGTGIRNRSLLAAVTCTVGGVSAPVEYAGAQGTYIGLDQINVRLPKSLRGRGVADFVLVVDGQQANTVQVQLK